jgi:hypothetical protein
MKLLILLLAVVGLNAQTMVDYPSQIKRKPISAAATLPSSCTVTGNLFVLTTTNQFYVCNAGVYVIATASATLTPPVAIAGSTSGNLVTITQSGAGEALDVTGLAVFHGTGVISPVFNCAATGSTNCVQQASGTFGITGAGNAAFQTVVATTTFNSLATGTTSAFQQGSGTFTITGAGNASFQTVVATSTFNSAANTAGSPSTTAAFQTSNGNMQIFGDGTIRGQLVSSTNGFRAGVFPGSYGLDGSGVLTVASCTGCGGGGGAVAGSNAQVQFNSSGAFGASANFTWSNANSLLTVARTNTSSGMISPAFNANVAGLSAGAKTFQNSDGSFGIDYQGNAAFQSLALTNGISMGGNFSGTHAQNVGTGDIVTFGQVTGSTAMISPIFNCTATGTNNCVQQASGTFLLRGDGYIGAQSIKTGANNGTSATAGDGADFSKSTDTISIRGYDSGGNCGIGTGAPSPGILCSSDARLKTPLIPLQSGLSEILRLNPGTYTWRASGARSVGFIAQSVREVLPNLVTEGPGPDHYLMLSESGVVPYLVKAVQELEAQIEDLKRGPTNRTNRTEAEWRAQR